MPDVVDFVEAVLKVLPAYAAAAAAAGTKTVHDFPLVPHPIMNIPCGPDPVRVSAKVGQQGNPLAAACFAYMATLYTPKLLQGSKVAITTKRLGGRWRFAHDPKAAAVKYSYTALDHRGEAVADYTFADKDADAAKYVFQVAADLAAVTAAGRAVYDRAKK
jgi:hypothetical protein